MPVPEKILSQVKKNVDSIIERIEAACSRVNRDLDSVTFIAVTKYASDEILSALLELGYNQFGERRPQQLQERAANFEANIDWHMIGHLQRNKVRSLLPIVDQIHSVDSVRLIEKIDQTAAELKLKPKVYLEVNVSGEESKDGFEKNEFLANYEKMQGLQNVEICGLMTMAPRSENPEVARTVFRDLRELSDQLESDYPSLGKLPGLSMGMSGDYEVAIEEGATHVRIGSALFEGIDS